jgi:CRP-like cAMP-binding protein
MSLSSQSSEVIYSSTDFSGFKEAVLNAGRELAFSKGMTLRPKKNEILIVMSGQMSVSASSKHDLIIGHTFPFFPIGLLELYYEMPLYYKAELDIVVTQLSEKEFNQVVLGDSKNSALLIRILTFMTTEMIHVYFERNNDSGYATIRQMLMRYMYKSENDKIGNEGVASFILKRTRLSRSYVFQILSGLKAGGYITVKNGKLTSINRDIPKRF